MRLVKLTADSIQHCEVCLTSTVQHIRHNTCPAIFGPVGHWQPACRRGGAGFGVEMFLLEGGQILLNKEGPTEGFLSFIASL